MNTGMHLRMRTVRLLGRALGATALALVLAACGHRAPASSAVMLPALQPPQPPEPGPTYRIQLGDELHVRFTFQPEMNEQVPVRPDGRISLVSTGEIDAVGHTPPELERVIVERSSAHLRNPEVTVIVTKLGEQRVYVGGEVLTPGYIPLRAGMTSLAMRTFFYAVFKHTRLVVGTFLLIFLAAAVTAIVRPTIWMASTTVLVKLGETAQLAPSEAPSKSYSLSMSPEVVRTEADIVKSYDVIRRAVEQLDMQPEPAPPWRRSSRRCSSRSPSRPRSPRSRSSATRPCRGTCRRTATCCSWTSRS